VPTVFKDSSEDRDQATTNRLENYIFFATFSQSSGGAHLSETATVWIANDILA